MHADQFFPPHVPPDECVDLALGLNANTFADVCDDETALGDEHRAQPSQPRGMNGSRAADNMDRRSGACRIWTVMCDGCDAAEQVLRDSCTNSKRAGDGLDGRNRHGMAAVDGVARSAGNDFAYPLPLDDHVANAGAAEDFHVAQNYHGFMKCIPNTSGCPLCFSYAFKYCARSNNGRTDSSIARSAAKTAVSPHPVAM